MPPTPDEIQARLFLTAALPLTKVVREDDKWIRIITKHLKAVVQFEVKNTDFAAHLIFENDALDAKQGRHEKPTVSFVFKDLKSFNDFFAGRLALPSIQGLYRVDVVARVLPLLLYLKILMPDADPTDPAKRAMKVKLLLYMITKALSQLNRVGDPEMNDMTKTSPDRIFQFSVVNGPSAYLRMKAGKTKSGRGVYTRRRPFVLFQFPDYEGAYNVLTSKVPMVEAVAKGYLHLEGAMEYQKEIGLHMQRIEEFLTR